LRCNFVAAAHPSVRLTPQFLRALSRLWRESFLRNRRLPTFYEIINIDGFEKSICRSKVIAYKEG
jgi:hypothetical protein